MEGDLRGWRVALVAGELLNGETGVDVLGVLERGGWGAIQLPAAEYPDEVASPLLEQVAEQTQEFAKDGYQLVVLGERQGLRAALAAYGIGELPSFAPADEAALEAFLAPFPAAPTRGATPAAAAAPRRAAPRPRSRRPPRQG